jgi:hypothetical protein
MYDCVVLYLTFSIDWEGDLTQQSADDEEKEALFPYYSILVSLSLPHFDSFCDLHIEIKKASV